MIRALNIVFILLTTTAFTQEFTQKIPENYSFYFGADAGNSLKEYTSVDKQYFGNYSLIEKAGNEARVAAGDLLVIDETGIAIEKNRIHTISREEVRENSKYWVTNGYIHGIVENDSLPVAPDEDNYLFLLPVKNYLFKPNSNSKLFKGTGNADYLILTREDNGYFSALYITMSSGKVELKELNFDEKCKVTDVNKREEVSGVYPTYILSPDKLEWAALFGCFETYDSYSILTP